MVAFIHKRLSRKPGIWRVDGIAPLESRNRLGTRTAVLFSEIKEASKGAPYRSSSRTGETLRLSIQSASIREFTIGSLWRDGRRIGGPEGVPDLLFVDLARAQIVTLNEQVKLGEHSIPSVLPERYFEMGLNRAELESTYYLIAPVLDNPLTKWIVIACSELLRFYTGSSSRLLSTALQGRLDTLVDWQRCRREGDLPVVHVKRDLSRQEAAVFARAINSAMAKANLLAPHQHLSTTRHYNSTANANNQRPYVIRASFPYRANTHLQVAGKRINLAASSEPPQWGVFAMELQYCPQTFGSEGAIIESDEPWDGGIVSGKTEGGSNVPRNRPKFDEDDDEEDQPKIDDVPADPRLRRLVTRTFTNQFGGLTGFKLQHRRPRIRQGNGSTGPVIDVVVNTLTSGDGSHGSEGRGNLGVSDFQTRVENVDRDLTLFLELVKHLRKITKARGWKVSTRKLNDALALDGEQIAVFPEKLGKRRTWHLVNDADGTLRPRQVVWAEFALNEDGPYIYLLEMELKPGENGQCTLLMFMQDYSWLEDDVVQNLFKLTAIKNRWPDLHHKWDDPKHKELADLLFQQVHIRRLNHPAIKSTSKKALTPPVAKPKLDPASWAVTLLAEIDEIVAVAAA